METTEGPSCPQMAAYPKTLLLLLLSHFSCVRLYKTHRRQPTRLPHPWDSPGNNTGGGCHFLPQCMKVRSESKVAQSCPTLHDTMDCSLPGSSVHGILQARVLEWGAITFSDPKTLRESKSWACLKTDWSLKVLPCPHIDLLVSK